MATYVFSDVHGHKAVLERALERVSPSSSDTFFCLGDMIDRGPDPVGVMRICRNLENCTVLLGNHEDMMLAYFKDATDPMGMVNWSMNGGMKTAKGLDAIDANEAAELIDWIKELPYWAYTNVSGQDYILVHAGIDPSRIPKETPRDKQAIVDMMCEQDPMDLLWIREDFWCHPTGLVDEDGTGPIVIAGHTPTAYLDSVGINLPHSPKNDDGRCMMVKLGSCSATAGVADKWDIDCGCAAGADMGQLLIVRLDDGETFYEPVRDGE